MDLVKAWRRESGASLQPVRPLFCSGTLASTFVEQRCYLRVVPLAKGKHVSDLLLGWQPPVATVRRALAAWLEELRDDLGQVPESLRHRHAFSHAPLGGPKKGHPARLIVEFLAATRKQQALEDTPPPHFTLRSPTAESSITQFRVCFAGEALLPYCLNVPGHTYAFFCYEVVFAPSCIRHAALCGRQSQ